MSALYLAARAKLNLVLQIVGRRDDGYHLLETLFHAIELHDDLWLALQDGATTIEVTSDHPREQLAPGDDNLVIRALRQLGERAEVRQGFRARLHKRIPVGGGLGGGSSDAAAALRAGNRLLGEPLSREQLHALARGLGADVAFFLIGGSCWGRGVGDELSAAVVPDQDFVLVVPPFDCPTAEVYKNYAACWNHGPPQVTTVPAPIPTTRDSALRIGFSNDLTPAAESVRPALAALRRRVADLGRLSVHMTGSGSTVFVPCADEAAAIACERRLALLTDDGVRVLRTRSAGPLDEPTESAWPTATAHPGDREDRGDRGDVS